MSVVALVPLRGGSKGIPNKNIIDLCGKPLCYWSLKAAALAETIDSVYVSTDSEMIAEVVSELNLGVRVIRRPSDLATDVASTDDVALHFSSIVDFGDLITIQATSPMVESHNLDEAFRKYKQEDLDSLISIYRQKQFLWDEEGRPNYDPMNRPRRQEFDGVKVENGSFYISKRKLLIKLKTRVGGRVGFYDMGVSNSFEIDEDLDLKVCEAVMTHKLSIGTS